jgi:hypothetical protein
MTARRESLPGGLVATPNPLTAHENKGETKTSASQDIAGIVSVNDA